jgi:hypothetical protein
MFMVAENIFLMFFTVNNVSFRLSCKNNFLFFCLIVQRTLDCSNYTGLLQQMHAGNGSDYRLELETAWNATSGLEISGFSDPEVISPRDVLLQCLRADFK